MSAYSIGLFVHVASDIALIIGIGVWLVAYSALRRATRIGEVQVITGLMFFSEAFYAITGVLLLGSGVYMTIKVWGFDTAWIVVALGTLFVVLPVGPLFAEPRMKAIARSAKESEDGPLPPDLLAKIHNPMLGTSLYVNMAGVIGIVFLMTVKPLLIASIVAIIVALLLGIALSVPLWMSERKRLPGV